jgi:hypothetical protein
LLGVKLDGEGLLGVVLDGEGVLGASRAYSTRCSMERACSAPRGPARRGARWRGPARCGPAHHLGGLLGAELDGEGLLSADLLSASRACSARTSDFSFNANTSECGHLHLHGSSCFGDKGGREENGWTREKGCSKISEPQLTIVHIFLCR